MSFPHPGCWHPGRSFVIFLSNKLVIFEILHFLAGFFIFIRRKIENSRKSHPLTPGKPGDSHPWGVGILVGCTKKQRFFKNLDLISKFGNKWQYLRENATNL